MSVTNATHLGCALCLPNDFNPMSPTTLSSTVIMLRMLSLRQSISTKHVFSKMISDAANTQLAVNKVESRFFTFCSRDNQTQLFWHYLQKSGCGEIVANENRAN